MSLRASVSVAVWILASGSVSDLSAQTCRPVTQVLLRQTGAPQSPTLDVVRYDSAGSTLETIKAVWEENGWKLERVFNPPVCLDSLDLSPTISGFTRKSIDRASHYVDPQSGVGIYWVTLERTWTLDVVADGEKGPIDVLVTGDAPRTDRRETDYLDGVFSHGEEVDLNVYVKGTYFYKVKSAALKPVETHDKRYIMDGVCKSSSPGPVKRFCSCSHLLQWVTCLSQKRKIDIESIKYTKVGKE